MFAQGAVQLKVLVNGNLTSGYRATGNCHLAPLSTAIGRSLNHLIQQHASPIEAR